MVIFLDAQGNAEIITPESVYQGSNNITELTVIGPLAPQTQMYVGFILPDGLYWENDNPNSKGERYMPMQFIEQDIARKASVWKYTIPFSVTSTQGEVQIAINAVSNITPKREGAATIQSNRTSYLCRFTVQESVVPNLPETPDPSVNELVMQYLAVLDARTAVLPQAVAGIKKTAPNAFQAVTLGGTQGAEIVLENDLGTPLAPIGAASRVELASTSWTAVDIADATKGYKAIIPAALHTQMRDGATARDLWVGFDEVENGTLTGADPSYTVNEAGDITVTVNTPVAMTVRVWNGKGLNANSIASIIPYGNDSNGGNIYKITLTNGDTYFFIAPKGDTGNGFSDEVMSEIERVIAATPENASAEDRFATESYVDNAIDSAVTTALNTPV